MNKKKQVKTTLIIARHGNTFAPGDIITRVGKTDLPLVDSGLEQGRNIGAYLKKHDLIPDIIFTSDLKRTQQTAEQAVNEMHAKPFLESLSIFNEIDYGPDENQPEEKVVARLGSDAIKAWDDDAAVPDGWNVNPQKIIHNWRQFSKLIHTEYPGSIVMVVTSNGIARFAPHITGDFDGFRSQHKIKIATGALCIFEHENSSDNWHCVHWNMKPESA